MWVCPDCERRFGRVNQGHECAPALSLDEYFETGPAFERSIFEAVRTHLSTVTDLAGDDIWIEPVSVGVFFKRRSTFLSLRTMTKWIATCFYLDRKLDHGRISRKVQEHNGRYYHVVNVRSAEEVDDQLCEWLTEAWEADAPADRSL